MKTLEVDDELYQFIAGKTEHIGESASSILRRLLGPDAETSPSQPQSTAASPANVNTEPAVTEPAEPPVEPPVEPSVAPVALPEPIEEVIFATTFRKRKSAAWRFLSVLSALHRWDPEQFVAVLEIQGSQPNRGRSRKYFALSEAELQLSGKSTAPRQIAGSPYWVITNTNTKKKRSMVSQVASKLNLSEEQSAWLAEQI